MSLKYTYIMPILVIALLIPRIVSASVLAELEPNNAGATAQNVNGNFSLDSDANILNSTAIPHVSVQATGDGTFDFYTFTTSQAGTIILDIDAGAPSADISIGIWTAAGALVALDQNSGIDPGSIPISPGSLITLDPGFTLTNQPVGTYIVGVCEANCSFGTNFIMTVNMLDVGDSYTLHISAAGATVPEPSAFILFGSALLVLGLTHSTRVLKR